MSAEAPTAARPSHLPAPASEIPTIGVDTRAPVGDACVMKSTTKEDAMNAKELLSHHVQRCIAEGAEPVVEQTCPAISTFKCEITFSRPLEQGEADLLYEYIVDSTGVEDSYDTLWTTLYGGPEAKGHKDGGWAITGIQVLNPDSVSDVLDGYQRWMEQWEADESC